MRKERIVDIIRVVNFIQKNPNTYLKEIARNLNMNPAVVHRTLKDIDDFIVTRSINEELNVNLPNLPVMIRLRDNITVEGILKFLNIKEKLGKFNK